MLLNALKESEWDLNINLPIKISAADLSIGFTNICFIFGFMDFKYKKFLVGKGEQKMRVSRPVKPTHRIKCGIRQGMFLNEG